MKKLLLATILAGTLAQAGVVKVATFPVRHPAKTTKACFKAAKVTIVGVAKALYNL